MEHSHPQMACHWPYEGQVPWNVAGSVAGHLAHGIRMIRFDSAAVREGRQETLQDPEPT